MPLEDFVSDHATFLRLLKAKMVPQRRTAPNAGGFPGASTRARRARRTACPGGTKRQAVEWLRPGDYRGKRATSGRIPDSKLDIT